MLLYSYMYEYVTNSLNHATSTDKKNMKVILEEHNGWVQPPPESVCIVGNGSDHFQWIKPKK